MVWAEGGALSLVSVEVLSLVWVEGGALSLGLVVDETQV